jgi:hypothetical protein
MALTTQELILSLPTDMIERIEQAASRRQQSPSDVVYEILNISLPPLSHRTQPPLRPLVEKLERQPRREIERKANSWLEKEAQERLSELLQHNRERKLTEKEDVELEGLLDKVQANAMESAAAKWVLENSTEMVRK